MKAVFVDLPLESLHPQALKAAEAASCAGDQGKYWPMHDRLFASQDALEPWGGNAEAVGLDVARFEQCLAGQTHTAGIRRKAAEANQLGITSAPYFLIGRTEAGGTKVSVVTTLQGAVPFASFKEAIDRLLAEGEAPGSGRP